MNKRFMQIIAVTVIAGLAWIAGSYSVTVNVQPGEARAMEYQQLEVKDQYVYLDDTALDLAVRPVLIIDSNCENLVALVKQIPGSRQPSIVFCQDTAGSVPEFMNGLGYSICRQSKVNCPSLLTWDAKEGLQGYMFNAVNEHLYEWGYPRLLGLGQVWNNTGDPSGNNSYRAAEQSQFVIIQPGQEYRFYDYVLPSVEAGYQEGQSIFPDGSGGYTWGPDLGGGICKTATVLHYAVTAAGLTETERNHHSLQVSYALPGDDAAVSRDSADYRFVNTLSHPIVIVFQQTDDRLMAGIYEVLDPASAQTDIAELMAVNPWEFDSEPLLLTTPLTEIKAAAVSGPTLRMTLNSASTEPGSQETPAAAVPVSDDSSTTLKAVNTGSNVPGEASADGSANDESVNDGSAGDYSANNGSVNNMSAYNSSATGISQPGEGER